ncbi:MAG: aminotransferase class III-fold pyridoxal phosphate-dependent enzyme [Flavobacteriaceae bacterium]|nr:aminotransferase class III-fold pyridoxal phosphate-dependent enzyme [Flavobacteriaceae bacterium]MDG2235046.1 aminotransferase class III-fold pyridoxal phosphate-dependent enzyme [Flavobacteriaceae bacterium]|tara:strand:+ start:3528 stop:4712 length:1185 start_codon:yes stop_codon:yes gene_type:complete
MDNLKEDFLEFQAMTTPSPLGLTVKKAKGAYITSTTGKKYLDFIAGVSACSLGHRHPKVVSAIRKQTKKYMHVMVYGEFAQEPSVTLCKELVAILPENQESIYLTNSGTEAIEGAIKLAKRATGRSELIGSFKSYHGSTHGALSLLGSEHQKEGYRPLIPGTRFIRFNSINDLVQITTSTAAVLLETIQGGAGFILPNDNYLKKVKERCQEVGALLILDEIQPGFGRTGLFFGFEHYSVEPDIVVMGKGMGGGLPVGAFSASHSLMRLFKDNPKLGHISTFGGNPVIAAASLATLRELRDSQIIFQIKKKEALFRQELKHKKIKEIRGKGLMLALIVENPETANKIIFKCLDKGLILFWLLWEKNAIRISPPLTIKEKEIIKGCKIIQEVLDSI